MASQNITRTRRASEAIAVPDSGGTDPIDSGELDSFDEGTAFRQSGGAQKGPPKSAVPGRQDAAPTATTLANPMVRVERWLETIALGAPTPNRFDHGLDGSQIPQPPDGLQTTYVKLYENDLDRKISVRVQAIFAAPGGRVKISLAADASDLYKIDDLALSGNQPNGILSAWTPLLPGHTLYIGYGAQPDGSYQPLSNADRFSVQIFDPAALAGR